MFSQELLLAVGAGLLAGLASVPHCAAMCGPLACFATVTGAGSPNRALRYQAGRMISYGAVGAGVGAAGEVVLRTFSGALAGALVSWVFAAALGLAAFRLWRSDRPVGETLDRQPAGQPAVTLRRERGTPSLTQRLFSLMPKDPLLFGAATALLPCGALYGALLLAAGTATVTGGAGLMMGFTVTSGLGLVSVAWLSTRLRGRLTPVTMRLLAVVLAAAAIFIAIRPAATLAQPEEATPACCGTER